MPSASIRAIAVCMAVAGLSAGTAACGDGDDTNAASATPTGTSAERVTAPAGLQDPGTMKVCADVSYPPMEYYEGSDTSDAVGFDIDAAEAVAEQWGVEPRIINTSFDGLLPALEAGRCDVVWSSIAVTPERTKRFPAVPYYRTSTVLLVGEGNPEGVNSPEALSGKTLALESGTAVYLAYAKKINAKLKAAGKAPARVQTYPKATDAIQQLIVGRAAAVITQVTEAAYRIKQQPGKFEIGYTFDDQEVAGIYFDRSKPEIGTAVKKALDVLEKSGELEQIAKRYELPVEGLEALREKAG